MVIQLGYWVYFGNKEEHDKSKSQWISFLCYFLHRKCFLKREKPFPFGFDENFFSGGASSTATSLNGKVWRYWKALRIAKNGHFDYPKNPINCRSTFSQCVFFTSAANPNDFGSLGTRWSVPVDCFPSWLRLLVDDVELTGRIICCMLLKLGIFRNILTWTIFKGQFQIRKGQIGSIETVMC